MFSVDSLRVLWLSGFSRRACPHVGSEDVAVRTEIQLTPSALQEWLPPCLSAAFFLLILFNKPVLPVTAYRQRRLVGCSSRTALETVLTGIEAVQQKPAVAGKKKGKSSSNKIFLVNVPARKRNSIHLLMSCYCFFLTQGIRQFQF